MAHRGHRKNERQNDYRDWRGTNATSNQRLPDIKPAIRTVRKIGLRDYEDRRTWHPDNLARPARTFSSWHHRLSVKGIPVAKIHRPGGYQYNFATGFTEPIPWRIGFEDPKRVLICARRKIRREVLNALGIAGVAGVARKLFKKPRKNEYSKISC